MSITKFSSLPLMASASLSAINGLPMPRIANPMIASVMDEGGLKNTLAGGITNTNQSDNADSLPVRLPRLPLFTWTHRQWMTTVAHQTLSESDLHIPAQERVDKLVEIIAQDGRYMPPWYLSVPIALGSVGLMIAMSVAALEIQHGGIENVDFKNSPIWTAMTVVGLFTSSFLMHRAGMTDLLNYRFPRIPSLTIARAEWGEELPRHEEVDEDSMPLP